MRDSFLLGILPQYHYRFQLADISEIAGHAGRIHNLDRGMSVLLANTFLGSFFLAAQLKNNQKVSIQWKDETKKSVLAYSDRYGNLKGVAYSGEFQSGDLRNDLILGQGILKVIRWQEDAPPYQSYTNLIESTVEENLKNYINESEQLTTHLFFQSDSDGIHTSAKGMMFQALPEATEDHHKALANKLFPIFKHDSVFYGSPKDWKIHLEQKTGITFEELHQGNPNFVCDCSRIKVKEVIVSLGETEARSIFEEQGKVELSCEFCLSQYSFNQEDLDQLFVKKT